MPMRGRSWSSTVDERAPLLDYRPSAVEQGSRAVDHHDQFCSLMGVKPYTFPPGQTHTPHPQSLYSRALERRRNQNWTYAFTASLANGLLLSQVVLGAALTGLGASDSSRVLITIFGALNTIIAGVIAFLKSRGQPLRARMFRDDLDRVVDEIESSAVMWLGISSGAHGYDAIDTDDAVTVRSEVARLTRLYDRAVKANTTNDPDLYAAGGPGDFHHAALRSRPGQPMPVEAPQPPSPAVQAPQAPVVQPPVAVEPEESPATKPPTPPDTPKPAEPSKDTTLLALDTTAGAAKQAETPKESSKSFFDEGITDSPRTGPSTITSSNLVDTSTPGTPATEQPDPDASPATAAHPPAKEEAKTEKVEEKMGKSPRLEKLRRLGSDV